MEYRGDSKVVAGITAVGNTISHIARYVVRPLVIGMFVTAALFGPRYLPWYKG